MDTAKWKEENRRDSLEPGDHGTHSIVDQTCSAYKDWPNDHGVGTDPHIPLLSYQEGADHS